MDGQRKKPERSQSFHIKCDRSYTTYYEIEYNRKRTDSLEESQQQQRSASVPRDEPLDVNSTLNPDSSQIYKHLEYQQPIYTKHFSTLGRRKPSPLLGSVILTQKINQERMQSSPIRRQTPVENIQSYPDLLNELPSTKISSVHSQLTISQPSESHSVSDYVDMGRFLQVSPPIESPVPPTQPILYATPPPQTRSQPRGRGIKSPIRRSASTVSDIQQVRALYQRSQFSPQKTLSRIPQEPKPELFVLPVNHEQSSNGPKPRRFSSTSTTSTASSFTRIRNELEEYAKQYEDLPKRRTSAAASSSIYGSVIPSIRGDTNKIPERSELFGIDRKPEPKTNDSPIQPPPEFLDQTGNKMPEVKKLVSAFNSHIREHKASMVVKPSYSTLQRRFSNCKPVSKPVQRHNSLVDRSVVQRRIPQVSVIFLFVLTHRMTSMFSECGDCLLKH